jgi:tRNA pseudouridine55 synthase
MVGGIINLLKPPGMTSHDVVSFVRKAYGLKRVGHAGTLDPAAAGVLPVFLGQATRLIEYTTDTDKSYRVELTFGYETDTGDDTGKVIKSAPPYTMPNSNQVEDVLQSFVGTIEQIPPMYSAIKVDGKKMYELARAGITVERQPRTVIIHNISMIKLISNGILFDVTCSKGTYMRSLCTDIGEKLGCLAVMSFLVRTRVGQFSLLDAWTIEEVMDNQEKAVLFLDCAVEHMPKVILQSEKAQAFKHGQIIASDGSGQGTVRVYDANQCLIGIGQQAQGSTLITPIKVLS